MLQYKYVKLEVILFLLISITFFAQDGKVGISSVNSNFVPQENLDIDGMLYAKSIIFKNPGEPLETGGKFLGSVVDKAVRDAKESPFTTYSNKKALFNYIHLVLDNVSPDGVVKFNTKINASEFVLVLHNYSFKNYKPNDEIHGTTTVVLSNNVAGQQGSPNLATFIEDGVWKIRASFTNSKFTRTSDATFNAARRFTIELYLMAYRYLITKQNIPEQSVNLNSTDGSGTGYSVPKPTGF